MTYRPDKTNTCEFQIGDHIYQWCSFVGIPSVFQHHGIVMDCYWKQHDDKNENESTNDENVEIESSNRNANNAESSDADGEWIIEIADFSNVDHLDRQLQQVTTLPDGTTIDTSFSAQPSASNRKRSFGISSKSSKGGGYQIRTFTASLSSKHEKWHRVIYSANWWQRHIHRTGTCTGANSDPPGLVRARVQFLIDHPELLPKYDIVTSNCECVAVWCKTGTWATLQAINWLVMTAAGQVKSAVTVGSVAAATQVTVPAAGFWGWMGYTTTVPFLSTQPYLLPAIIGYGVVTVAVPTLWLLHAKNHAKQTTEKLNKSFWEQAVDQPEIFVECITNWSALYEPTDGEENYQILNSPTAEHVVEVSPQVPVVSVHEDEIVDKVPFSATVLNVTSLQSTGQQSLEEAK
jgi:hypothetical protein